MRPNALDVTSGIMSAVLRVRGRHVGLAVPAARVRGADSGLTLGVQSARSDAEANRLRGLFIEAPSRTFAFRVAKHVGARRSGGNIVSSPSRHHLSPARCIACRLLEQFDGLRARSLC